MKKIEIAVWHRCNCRCAFCSSQSMEGAGFSFEEVVALLSGYKKKGAVSVDFGGGEPTAREDLPSMAKAAAELGYTGIGVKSNGMMFCYPDYVKTCMDAGVNEFSISLWGYPPGMHNSMAGKKRAFEMTEMGLKHLVDFGADVCVDYLVRADSVNTLGDALSHLARKVGVRKFRLWVFSVFGAGGRMESLLPSLSVAGEAAASAYNEIRDDVEWVKTSHIPPCLLGDACPMYFNIKGMDLLIVTPGNTFRGEESPFEKGVYLQTCRVCSVAHECAGPREEYVRLRGGGEFKAI